MEDREIAELLADFETVWQRVSPPPEEQSAQEAETNALLREACNPQQRVPRWFVVV